MKLTKLFDGFKYNVVLGNDEIEISKITDNTNDVSEDDVFFCIKGYNFDGHNFIDIVLSKGAKVIVINNDFESKLPNDLDCVVISVDDTRKALSIAAINFYGRLHEKFKIIGVQVPMVKQQQLLYLEKFLKMLDLKQEL